MGINIIQDITTYDKMELQKTRDVKVDDAMIISTGFTLIKIVKKLDGSLAPMITTTFFSCIFVATLTLYNSMSVLFGVSNKELILSSAATLGVAILSISRLCRITQCSYELTKEMKECAYRLERFKFKKDGTDQNEVELLKQDLRYHCESPIAPFSAFSVSTSTLVGTFGTIVTYLIVLLQFKVSEPQKDDVKRVKSVLTKNITSSNLTTAFN